MDITEMTNVASRKLTSIVRVLAIVLGGLVILSFPYFVGVYSTLFETNLCYSNVISSLDEKAEAAISAGTSDAATGFRHLVNSLPLAGYETNCDAVAKKLNIQGLSGARSVDESRNHEFAQVH
jgi:hypothetical protein